MTEQARRHGSIRDVAREAKVSLSTVSNVLNKPQLVADGTRMRVEQAMATVGFIRNAPARQLRGAPSSVVGAVLVDIANPFYAQVARGIQDRLAEEGLLAVLCNSDVQQAREQVILRELLGLGVRGIVLSPVAPRIDELVQVDRGGTRIVLLDHLAADGVLSSVGVDHVEGGRLAAVHLLELGHRRIAVLRADADMISLLERAEGARSAVEAAGLDADAVLVDLMVEHASPALSVARAIDRIFSMQPQPTAVVAFNDVTAIQVLGELRERRVRVPEELSVIGYDDLPVAAVAAPALTTIAQPTFELGRRAAGLLLADDDATREVVTFTPTLVVRESTAHAPG